MKKKFLSCALLVSLITSCKKTNDHPATNVLGQWQWVLSTGGVGPQIITPTSTGSSRSLSLNADSTYTFIADGTVTDAGTFSISKITNSAKSIEDELITFQPNRARSTAYNNFIILKSDTLIISTIFTWEGGLSKYTRRK
ncbi:hypothetical protein ABDD95_18870 [Mucilaginibacter sp. PAMB04274]|uniref:hypothetical protein n=1 Tax=Mucilaginibacter sp. PAMB04274 TaxID=3138568 RepID=UPI0031F7009A